MRLWERDEAGLEELEALWDRAVSKGMSTTLLRATMWLRWSIRLENWVVISLLTCLCYICLGFPPCKGWVRAAVCVNISERL